jgi:hypothetical protein
MTDATIANAQRYQAQVERIKNNPDCLFIWLSYSLD